MVWDLINREKLRRALLYLLYMAVCLLAQDSIFANFRLFGKNMFFLPAAVVAVGMFEDGVWGAVFGLALGFLTDISYDYTALFVAVFPVLGFFAGVLSRWYGLMLAGHELGAMLWTALIQVVWSLPMAAALYFPCKAIARKKI